jgi:hypothetical protein
MSRIMPVSSATSTHQGLGRDEGSRREVDFWLVPDRELPAVPCVAKVALEHQARADGGTELLIEDRYTVSAFALGHVHRGIRFTDEVIGSVGARRDGDAYACR